MTQFDEFENGGEPACAVCEAMLPEAVDGTLTAEEQRAFDRHVAGCVHCTEELAEARRGAAWLSMLKTRAPEPPAGLLERILAETSGSVWAIRPAGPLAAHTSRWAGLRGKLGAAFSFPSAQALLQPRLAMTAAMAFFSLALTLNLLGVRVSDVRSAHFTTGGVRRTVADESAAATREFENLRVVYQLESRVSELRNDQDK